MEAFRFCGSAAAAAGGGLLTSQEQEPVLARLIAPDLPRPRRRPQLRARCISAAAIQTSAPPGKKTPFLDLPLHEADSEIHSIIQNEKCRQVKSLELIASENFTSSAGMEAVGSCLTNKYSEGLPGDKSAVVPGGIRIGTPALTTRGFKEEDFTAVANLIHEGVQIAIEAKRLVGSPKLKDYLDSVESQDFPLRTNLDSLCQKVESFAMAFPIPGAGK